MINGSKRTLLENFLANNVVLFSAVVDELQSIKAVGYQILDNRHIVLGVYDQYIE